ncbi:rifin PIR protein, putative [Plasmodium reichenowi]|uniref:Rifin PIR protein, putative n=1 Tax=Plasmodium reichenowi TaxID=5854 RepID=A0A2P9DSW3_PLARE|nr:rifin PIR protein, putative [Plasmodium reichenowi]
MKVHYMNILLFALPLNILVHNQRNLKSTTPHTPKIPTARLLCECEIYMPNYNNDPEMQKVMENYNRYTSERFKEYDDRMVEKRKQCKDKCDKESQKIILKDKLEKQMAEQFATLDTDIQSDAIPTCICEKSIANEVEKGCLRCGGVLGGGVAPSIGLLGGMGTYAWKPAALKAAIEAALKANEAMISAAAKEAGNAAGMNVVTKFLKESYVYNLVPEIREKFSSTSHYANITEFAEIISDTKYKTCSAQSAEFFEAVCEPFELKFGISNADGSTGLVPNVAVPQKLKAIVTEADGAAKVAESATEAAKKAAIEAAQKGTIDAAGYNLYSAIGYSVLAIIIIVLVMVIIYLILRYRRKKKMKKKLQYIKLLEK